MARRKKNNQPRLIPAQDKRICGSICFCQLVVVISCVSFIYLTVAIYIPAYRAFHSDMELTPVMCQTINTSMLNNCSWASCGEWCLTKTSGFCPQIHVTTRQNGTTVQLQNCDKTTEFSCPNVKTQSLKKYNCNNGSECNSLTGFFNCSLGHCEYWSSAYHCNYNADGPVVDSDKDNTKLNGFFECKNSRCTKIRREFSCDRYCSRINTISGNIYISVDDSVHVAKCQKLIAFTAANGNEEGSVVEPTLVWSYHPKDIIMMSCNTIEKYGDTLNLTDCINGTMSNWEDIPKPSINFSTFWKIQDNYRQLLDAPQQFLPLQSTLMIYPTSHLYINLEGCVNTLKGECREFLRTHGRDGRNRTAPSRFPCYYNKNNSRIVVARHDLKKTERELIIAISIPSVFFVLSFISLCTIMYLVKVDDDTKMRCKYCTTNSEIDLNELHVRTGENKGVTTNDNELPQEIISANSIKPIQT